MDETTTGPEESRKAVRGWTAAKLTMAVVGALTLLRVVVLLLAFVNLGPDEAQYWAWAQHLAFGYFSKPPMIAWLIAGTTSVCGDGEACVRLSAPLLHGVTAMLVFLLTRWLYNPRTASWAAIGFATLPAVFVSSGLITTDVPLVCAWTAALYFYRRLVDACHDGPQSEMPKWAALTGLAVGLGLLAKYAMIYFFLCMVVHFATSRTVRRTLLSPSGAILLAVALLIVSPNLIWNAQEGFATLKHTAANANWHGNLFNVGKLGEFLGGQVGVFGPVFVVAYLFGLMTLPRRMKTGTPGADQFLAVFSAPILVVACGEAFISRANANWAGPAYVAATILATAWLLRDGEKVWLKIWRLKSNRKIWLRVSLAIHLVSGIVLYALITIPGAITLFSVENTFKRLRGWDTLAAEVGRVSTGGGYKAIMTEHRMVTAELLYYGRNLGLPIVEFDADQEPTNEFELKAPYTPEIGGPVLFVTWAVDASSVVSHFRDVTPLEVFRMQRNPPRVRAPPAQLPGDRPYAEYDLPFYIYRLDGFAG